MGNVYFIYIYIYIFAFTTSNSLFSTLNIYIYIYNIYTYICIYEYVKNPIIFCIYSPSPPHDHNIFKRTY